MKIILIGAKNPQIIKEIEAAKRINANLEVIGFLDNDKDKKGKSFYGIPILGGFELLDSFIGQDIYFLNTITRTTVDRYKTSKEIADKGFKFMNLINPTVDLSMSKIGIGNYIQEGVKLQADCIIGNNSAINVGSVVAHETQIGNSVFLAPRVALAGCITVGDGTLIGINATVLSRIKIGRWCTIGAGAVVTKDIPDYSVVAGNPARIIRINENLYNSGNIF